MHTILTGSVLLTSLLLIGCGGGGGSTRDKSLDTTISGTIYEDTNNNGIKNSKEEGIGQIKVTITSAKGKEHIVLTDTHGKYHLSKIVPGIASIEIDKATLPNDAIMKNEHLTTEHRVIVDKKNEVKHIPYTLPSISEIINATDSNGNVLTDENDDFITIEVGQVNGRIFKDFDASYDFSDGDEGLEGIAITMTDSNATTHTTTTDIKGNYVFSDVPVGTATISVNEDSVPDMESISQRTGRSTKEPKNNVTVSVKKGKRNKADSIGYFATSDTLGLVSGTIFKDTNRNGKYDDSDERLEGITVTIKDSAGVTHTVKSRNAEGHEVFKGQYFASVPPGKVTIIVPVNGKPFIGFDEDTDTVKKGKITYAGAFGFK